MELKYRKRVTTSIDIKLYEAFKAFSEKSRINQSKLFDEALADLLRKYGEEVPEKENPQQ